jgi:hypothetical protein
MEIRARKILKFIGSLESWEKTFVIRTLQISSDIKLFIYEHGDSFNLAEFCKQMGINEKDYMKFVNGEWDYSIQHISALECIWTDLKRAKLNVEIIKVKESKK